MPTIGMSVRSLTLHPGSPDGTAGPPAARIRPPLRWRLGRLVPAAALFGLGIGTGVVVADRLDPLRQDSVPMETWFRANVAGDAETMWQQESADYHTHFTSGHDAYVREYAHAPSPEPPTIRFVASVPLAGTERELFYAFDFGGRGRTVLPVYVDGQGRYDGPAI